MQPNGGVVGSDGGLFDQNNFSGLKSILDVPAGGVVGYILTSWDGEKISCCWVCLYRFTYLKWLMIC